MGFHSKPTLYVDHVTIKVQDLNRSLKFYQEIIGFDILEQTDVSAKLTADGKTSFLTLIQPENVIPKQRRTTGLYHFAILLPEKVDLANIVVHFVEKGIYFGSADHLVSEALYLQDLDGNEIEIYIDREPSEWTWHGQEVAMATEPLDFETLLKNRDPHKKWERLPKDTILGHIHLHVSDLKATEEFYVKGLGFEVVNRFGPQAIFLSTGQYHHHIGANTWNGVGAPTPPENSVGMESFRLVLPDEAVMQQTINNLRNIGATVSNEAGRILTHDPSGNRIELTV